MDTTDSAYGDKLIRLDTFDTAVAVDPRTTPNVGL